MFRSGNRYTFCTGTLLIEDKKPTEKVNEEMFKKLKTLLGTEPSKEFVTILVDQNRFAEHLSQVF
jgi:hypothetical protein